MKKRIMACLLFCALLTSCQAAGSRGDGESVDPPVTQTPSADDAARIEYYEQLVEELQKEILSLRTEIYVGRVEYEALLEDLLATDTPDTPTDADPDDGQAPQSPDFFYEIKDGTATVTAYVGKETTVTVPNEINGCPVVAIGDRAFMDRSDVVSVVLPAGVRKIGWFAFSGCVALQSVDLPDSVNDISYGAFENCPSAMTLRCAPDSYAARYAKSYGIAAVR